VVAHKLGDVFSETVRKFIQPSKAASLSCIPGTQSHHRDRYSAASNCVISTGAQRSGGTLYFAFAFAIAFIFAVADLIQIRKSVLRGKYDLVTKLFRD
jgi:hypothetical protein